MKIVQQIPNGITLLNLLSGCIGLYLITQNCYTAAAYLVFLGAFFDFIDGFAARLLKTASGIGKQLDSLADIVTFGVVPALIWLSFLQNLQPWYLNFLFLLMPIFTAIRLAKFNEDTRQRNVFFGLPSPAHGLFWAGLFISFQNRYFWNSFLLKEPYILPIACGAISCLMILPIPFLTLKGRASGVLLILRFILIGGSIGLFLLLQFSSMPFILLLYTLISIIYAKST